MRFTQRQRAWRAVIAVVVAAATPVATHAASFACERAGTAVERAICSDPVLSTLDDTLSSSWARARTARPAAEHKALGADQQAWLDRRNTCGAERECLRPMYTLRIAVLDAIAAAGASPDVSTWTGNWTRIASAGNGADLVVEPAANGRMAISLSASAGANAGEIYGDVSITASGATLRKDDCTLTLAPAFGLIEIRQAGRDSDCGAGNAVSYAGRYARVAAEGQPLPQWTLVALGLVRSTDDEAAIRTLMGAHDLDALIATANLVTDDADRDGLDATVTTMGVRGLFTLQESILMSAPDGRLWIALLDFDAHRNSQLRYYTNVDAWATRLPKTIDGWRERFRTVPVRMMSAPGQPIAATDTRADPATDE